MVVIFSPAREKENFVGKANFMAYPVDLIAKKNARNKPIWLENKYNLNKKDSHKNKFSSYTTVSIVIFNCNPHCNYNNNSDDTNLLFWTRA